MKNKPAPTSYTAIAKAINAKVSKSVREGKQVKIMFSQVSIYHNENCRDVFDEKGQEHVALGLEALKNGKALKNLTLTAIEFEDGTKGVKVVDGFHTHEITKRYIAHLKEQGIKEQKVGNTVYTGSEDTTFIAVDILDLDDYQQDLYKLNSQRGRKNDPIELVMFIDRMMKEHNKTIPEIAQEIGKPQSSIKNLMVLLNADDELIALIREGKIKASRAAAIMRMFMKENGIDGRKKGVDLSTVDFSPVTALVVREINIYEASETLLSTTAKTEPAASEEAPLTANSIVSNMMPITPSEATEAPRKRTRNTTKPQQLKPSEVTNIEQIITLLADRVSTVDGDSATINIHTALLEKIQESANKIKEKNEFNTELLNLK